MNAKKELPVEKKRISGFLEKNREKILNISIVEAAKIIKTSASMITRTLKEMGYYGWKDYKAFIVGRILTPINNNNYSKFHEKKFINRIKTSLGFWNSFDILKIISLIIEKKKIYFIAEQNEILILKYYKQIFRNEGIRFEILLKGIDSLSIIEDNSIIERDWLPFNNWR